MQNLVAMQPPAAIPQQTTSPIEPWVDLYKVAEHIGFSYNVTRKMVHDGIIPGHPLRNGKRLHFRFKLSEVDGAFALTEARS